MAYGTEIALVVDFDVARAAVDRGAPGLLGAAPDRDDWEVVVAAAHAAVASRLLAAHRQLLAARFGHAEVAATPTGAGPLLVTTVDGARHEVWPFGLQVVGDAGELDLTWPGMYRVGVPLVTRYWPTWLDVGQAHGGSDQPVVLDTATVALVDDARRALGSVVPELADAVLMSSPRWY